MIAGWRFHLLSCPGSGVLLLAMAGMTTSEARLIRIHAGPPAVIDFRLSARPGLI